MPRIKAGHDSREVEINELRLDRLTTRRIPEAAVRNRTLVAVGYFDLTASGSKLQVSPSTFFAAERSSFCCTGGGTG